MRQTLLALTLLAPRLTAAEPPQAPVQAPVQAQAQAQAQAAPPVAAAAALTAAMEAILKAPTGRDGEGFIGLVVVPDDFTAFRQGTAHGRPLVVRTRSEAREAQVAWFTYVDKVTLGPDSMAVSWQTPFNGYMGDVTVRLREGRWVVTERQEMHSSSSARSFYGRLYDGCDCKDGSEMARRWNDMMDAVRAMMGKGGKPSTPSSKCPDKTFPEVKYYQILKPKP